MEEIWKDIKGYEGKYQVSNLGRVKSLKNKWGNYREKILKASDDTHGYLEVNLCKDGKGKWFRIHRLVAQAFIPNPNNLPVVNHKDENPSNNNVENLEWCTQKYNLNYGTRLKKLSKPVICITTKMIFQSTKEASEFYGIKSKGNISSCCKGKLKYAGKYKDKQLTWKYLNYKHNKTYRISNISQFKRF